MKCRARKRSMIWGMLAVLALICCLLPVTVQAEPDPYGCTMSEDGQHAWIQNYQRSIDPTCTEDGYRMYFCRYCQAEAWETIPAYGHSWDGGTIIREATCTTDGGILYTCITCGAQVTEPIYAYGHNWDAGVVTRAATCTTDGVLTYTCYNCGATATEPIYAYGHNWDAGVVTQAATCVAEGVRTYTCYNCGATWTESIPATGHTPVAIAGWNPTCTQSGMTEGSVCAVCGAVLISQTEIPATGHAWNTGAVTKAATCTEPGVYTYTCYNCGATWNDTILANGHAWDEGVVTQEPEGFNPGIKTYTCWKCGAVYEETISPAQSLFHKLRNLPPAGKGPDFYISEQPQGGAVARYSGSPYPQSLMLSIQVEGGVEPYTYEWHFRQSKIDDEMDAGTIAGITGATDEMLEELVQGYQGAMEDWIGAWTYLYAKTHGETPETGGGATETELLLWSLLNDNDVGLTISPYNTATHEAFGGRYYYCVVTDATGNKVVSNLAEVRYAISIQPEYGNLNINKHAGDRWLYCNDIDGSYPKTYQWYLDDGSEAGVPLECMPENGAYEATSPGKYFCIVTDGYGDTARTKTYNLYEAEFFNLVADSGSPEIRNGESAELKIWVTGGVLPYTCEIEYLDDDGLQDFLGSLEGVLETSSEGGGVVGTYRYQLSTDKTGTYWFHLKDAMGAYLDEPIEVRYRQLYIKTQPEGGILPFDNEEGFELSVEMGEGTEPFTYELYWLGLGWEKDGFVNGDLYATSDENTITVTDIGTYYFIIRDAEGCWARSEFARVEPYELSLYVSDQKPQLTSSTDYIFYRASASNGEEPYTYVWEIYDMDECGFVPLNGIEDPKARVTENGTHLEVKKPGLYSCTVTDANGAEAGWMEEVTYAGKKPLILQDPQDIMVPFSMAFAQTTLTCEAVSGSGDDSSLVYEWERKTETGWETAGSSKELLLEEDGTREGQISGSYRCVVTDPVTGESSTSREAAVTVELVCYRSGQSEGSTVEFAFDGGKAPYSVNYSLYTYEPNTTNGGTHKLAYKFGHLNILDPGDMDVIIENINKDVKHNKNKDYYVDASISDATGQKCSEEILFVWK